MDDFWKKKYDTIIDLIQRRLGASVAIDLIEESNEIIAKSEENDK